MRKESRSQIVYLAGGFFSDWRKYVRYTLKDLFTWIDPKAKEFYEEGISHEEWTAEMYSAWDLHGIKQCDIFFCFIERDNPAAATLVELGYAKALNKTIILVTEGGFSAYKDAYLSLARVQADWHTKSLKSGLAYLKTYAGFLSLEYPDSRSFEIPGIINQFAEK